MQNKKFTRLLTDKEIENLSEEDLFEYSEWLSNKKTELENSIIKKKEKLARNYRILEGYKISEDKREIEETKKKLKQK